MNILFVGGGSGGHFYPCIEFIKYCIKKGDNCYFIGGINKYEEKKKNLIPCNYKFYEFNGFNNTFKSGIKLIKSYLKNKKEIDAYIKDNKIEKVILFGNFESLIVGLIAKRNSIPYAIHEQNCMLGRSNKILAKHAKYIFTSFPEININDKCICVGNPRTIKKFHIRKGNKILVILGSLGASNLIDKLLKYFEKANYDITFVLGENVINKYKSNHKIIRYFDHNKDSFDNYDFIITRGGATTLSEIIGYAVPFLVIPSPNVIKNHQEKNAMILQKYMNIEYIREFELNKEILFEKIDKYLSNNDLYLKTQFKIYNFAISNTCERMYKYINEKEKN